MRRVIILLIILLFIITIIVFSFNQMNYTRLKLCDKYIVLNELNEKLAHEVYSYNNTDDVLIIRFLLKNGKDFYLKVVFSEKLIGVPERGSNNYFRLTNKYIFEKSRKFTPLNNSIQNIILDYVVENESNIEFNTFWELEEFGNMISILKK